MRPISQIKQETEIILCHSQYSFLYQIPLQQAGEQSLKQRFVRESTCDSLAIQEQVVCPNFLTNGLIVCLHWMNESLNNYKLY